MSSFFDDLFEILQSGRNVVVARIISHEGSAPRITGTRCLIMENGSIVGTIGGGLLEYQVLQAAGKVFTDGRTRLIHFQLDGDELTRSGMICGGQVDVYLEPLKSENAAALKLFKAVAASLDSGSGGTLLTLIAEGIHFSDASGRAFVQADGSVIGDIGPVGVKDPALSAAVRDIKTDCRIELEADGPSVFVEPVHPADTVFLFGAGHISLYVAPLVRMLGFRVIVIDDRSEFANQQRFPDADSILVTPFSEAFERITVTDASYLIIVTRGHDHDETVLRNALQRSNGYIGMIGSKRKRDAIYRALISEGFRQDQLEEVHCPIGLEIQAETPEEIAVSIAGELILEKAKRKRKENKMEHK